MKKNIKLFGKLWTPVYEDDPDAAAAAAAAATAAEAEKNKGGGGVEFTPEQQEAVNKIVAEEKRKGQEALKGKIIEIETLTKKTNLTAKDRKALEGQLKTLKNEFMTKEELADQSRTKLVTEHNEAVEALTTDRDGWRTRHAEATISRSLTDAAVTHDAVSPEQIVSIMRQNTRMVEELDKDGKALGTYKPMTTIVVVKDGEDKSLELSPAEAVKQMKADERFYNLFKGDGTGGLGGTNRGAPGEVDVKEVAKDAESYRKARDAGQIPGIPAKSK